MPRLSSFAHPHRMREGPQLQVLAQLADLEPYGAEQLRKGAAHLPRVARVLNF